MAGTNYYAFYFDSENNCASPTVNLIISVNNCDIEYAYDFEFKTPGKLSPALLALARTYFDFDQAGEQVNIYDPLIYTIDEKNTSDFNDDEVLVEIVVTNAQYGTLQGILEASPFNKSLVPFESGGDLYRNTTSLLQGWSYPYTYRLLI